MKFSRFRIRALVVAVASLLVVLSIAASAAADVVLNPDGTITVGKGDVQSAFGWNNAQLQANASEITFIFREKDFAIEECLQPEGPILFRYRFVDADRPMAYRIRSTKTGKITGFVLTGVLPGPLSFSYGSWFGDAFPASCGTDPAWPITRRDDPLGVQYLVSYAGVSVVLLDFT